MDVSKTRDIYIYRFPSFLRFVFFFQISAGPVRPKHFVFRCFRQFSRKNAARYVFDLCCLKIMVAGNLETAIRGCF